MKNLEVVKQLAAIDAFRNYTDKDTVLTEIDQVYHGWVCSGAICSNEPLERENISFTMLQIKQLVKSLIA